MYVQTMYKYVCTNYVCNGFNDFSMLCLNISDIAIITVENVDYLCIMYNISKSEANNL